MLIKIELGGKEIYIPYVRNIAEDPYWKACVGPALNRLVFESSSYLAITNGWDEPLFRPSEISLSYSSIYGRGATIYMDVSPIDISTILLQHRELQKYAYPTEQEHRYLMSELSKYGCMFLWLIGVLLLTNRYEASKIISDIQDAKVNTMAYLRDSISFLVDYRPENDYELPELDSSSMLRCKDYEEVHKIFTKSGVIPYETDMYSQLITVLQELDRQFLTSVK